MGLPKSGLASKSNLHFFMISKYCENLREFLCTVFAKTKFEVLDIHYMETGIQYMEVKQNVEPAFFKSHTRKFSEILHSGFNKPRSFDFNIKTHAVFMARLLGYAL